MDLNKIKKEKQSMRVINITGLFCFFDVKFQNRQNNCFSKNEKFFLKSLH